MIVIAAAFCRAIHSSESNIEMCPSTLVGTYVRVVKCNSHSTVSVAIFSQMGLIY